MLIGMNFIYKSRNLISDLNSLYPIYIGKIYKSRNLISDLNIMDGAQKDKSTKVEILYRI